MSGATPTAFVFSAPPAGRTPEGSRPPKKSLKQDCWDTDDDATGTPWPGHAPGKTQAGVAPAPRVMTVWPLQPSTSKAVQTVIVPTQGFVNPFSQFYERPPPKKVTQTTRKNLGEPKMAAPQRKPVARSTTHRVAFANKPRIVRGKSDSPKPESTVKQFMRLSKQLWQN